VNPYSGRRRPLRPRLGRRVVRGLAVLLRAQDGNLLVVAATTSPGRRGEYDRAVRYLERLVAWAEARRAGTCLCPGGGPQPRKESLP
jgi:hypothetical protein